MGGALRLGITGGIGSGKSSLVAAFAGLGAAVIDTDAIARELTAAGGEAITALQESFGAAFIGPDGALDRAAMRARVFASPEARRRLEAVLHPLIGARSLARAQAAGAPLVVFDVPLLTEAAAFRQALQLDRILVVDCTLAQQRARVRGRGGLADHELDAILASQASRSQRLALADDVVVNGGTAQDLAGHARTLWQGYGLPPV